MQPLILQSNAEQFLKLYRVLESALEKRYADSHNGGSIIMHYLTDPDSIPYRSELDACRMIRNLLSHEADENGQPLVEPSDNALDMLGSIIKYVTRPKLAIDYGTPHQQILFVTPNELLHDTMHRMVKRGFSHVPVMEKGRVIGVLSTAALFSYLVKNGFGTLNNRSRIRDLKDALNFDIEGNHRYLFMPENTTLAQIRDAFESRIEQNNRLSVVFITPNGSQNEPLLAMLTHWDVLKEGNEN